MVFLLLLPSSLRSPIGRGGLVGEDEVQSGFTAGPALLPTTCTVTINPMPFLVLLEFRRVYSCRSLLFLYCFSVGSVYHYHHCSSVSSLTNYRNILGIISSEQVLQVNWHAECLPAVLDSLFPSLVPKWPWSLGSSHVLLSFRLRFYEDFVCNKEDSWSWEPDGIIFKKVTWARSTSVLKDQWMKAVPYNTHIIDNQESWFAQGRTMVSASCK